ncbi:MAG TPA: NAD-dependent epimerase/dehydratase family protein [Mucilaginibacter sp.]
MRTEKILVTGACGQIGTELVPALRAKYGKENVIASDRYLVTEELVRDGLYVKADVMNPVMLERVISHGGITQVYHLAAVLSASGEKEPKKAWDLNMQSLLNVLEAARKRRSCRVFWPSSIAVFGPGSPKAACPQSAVTDPTTIYGISKVAGEHWCRYYHERYGLDVRSVRFPGLISYSAKAGGGTTDYAVDIFHHALNAGHYTSFLRCDTYLPLLYMPDAIRGIIELMGAPEDNITIHTSYNLAGISFTPNQLAGEIRKQLPDFQMSCDPDYRQRIADSWPTSIDDRHARADWGWKPRYDLQSMTEDMLHHLRRKALSESVTYSNFEKRGPLELRPLT